MGSPHHLLGAELHPPLRNPQLLTLAHLGTSPGASLQPHPPTTITTVAFKTPLVKELWRTPSSGGHRTESLSSVHAGECGFPGTLLQLLHERYPTDHQSSIHLTGARPPAAPTRARAHTHCTEERIAKESARAVLGGVQPRLTGSRRHRDKCARSAAARSGRSTTFHQPSPQSLHPLLFHVRRGKPANLSGKRRGELEKWGAEGTSCSVTGTIPPPPHAVPGEPFARCWMHPHPNAGW